MDEKKKAKDAASAAIDDLVTADRMLARLAIAEVGGGHDPKNQKKMDKELAKAGKEMDKAGKELAKGKPDKAIDHYEKAWEHAQKAAKAAAK